MSDDRDPDRERQQKGDAMSDRLAARFERDSDDAEPAQEPSKPSESETSKPSKTEKPSVKDRPSVLMYLPEDLHEDLDIRFDELNAEYKREHGQAIEKNRDYYPALIEAGLEGKDIKDILDL